MRHPQPPMTYVGCDIAHMAAVSCVPCLCNRDMADMACFGSKKPLKTVTGGLNFKILSSVLISPPSGPCRVVLGVDLNKNCAISQTSGLNHVVYDPGAGGPGLGLVSSEPNQAKWTCPGPPPPLN